jgi:hypothetical protein
MFAKSPIIDDQSKCTDANTSATDVSVAIEPAAQRSETVIQMKGSDLLDADELCPFIPGFLIGLLWPKRKSRREGMASVEAYRQALWLARLVNDLSQFYWR